VGVNGCTAVEIPESPMYTEDAWYVRKTYVALHTWTYRPEKKKKTNPRWASVCRCGSITYPSNGLKKKGIR
jgi:hypothetical protein